MESSGVYHRNQYPPKQSDATLQKTKNCQKGHGVVYLTQDIGGTKLFRRKNPAPIRHLLLGSKLRLTVQRGTEATGARLVTPTRTTEREC